MCHVIPIFSHVVPKTLVPFLDGKKKAQRAACVLSFLLLYQSRKHSSGWSVYGVCQVVQIFHFHCIRQSAFCGGLCRAGVIWGGLSRGGIFCGVCVCLDSINTTDL
jgi:hypothetical protein